MPKLQYLNKGKKVSLEELLNRKEERQNQIYSLLGKCPRSTIINFSLNIPGPIKNNKFIGRIFELGLEKLKEKLREEEIEVIEGIALEEKTGPEFICSIKAPAKWVKEICVKIEEEERGRIFDFDVEDTNGAVSRRDIGYPQRRCFLCYDKVDICRRLRRHSMDDLLSYIEDMYSFLEESAD